MSAFIPNWVGGGGQQVKGGAAMNEYQYCVVRISLGACISTSVSIYGAFTKHTSLGSFIKRKLR